MRPDYFAIKRLTQSDLSLFHFHFDSDRSKQKAINLNSNIFVSEFYPNFLNIRPTIVFPMIVTGPGGQAAYELSRKIVRSSNSKNWRLNGELIYNPDGEPERYNCLQPGDYAIFAFEGQKEPSRIAMVLVSLKQDPEIHRYIADNFLNQNDHQSMRAISYLDLHTLFDLSREIYQTHPLQMFVTPDSPEEALFGPFEQTAVRHKTLTRLSPETLTKQLEAAANIGKDGEEWFCEWLIDSGHCEEKDFDWTSLIYARAPYDFRVYQPKWLSDKEELYIDVKTTSGPFHRPIHMSYSELEFASLHPNYRIARIYHLGTKSVKVRILSEVHEFAVKQIRCLEDSLLEGAMIDGFRLHTELFEVEYEE